MLTDLERELLTALKGAEEWLKGWMSAEPYLSRIQAAIARAEAKAKEPHCKCVDGWASKPNTICAEFIPSAMKNAWCQTCGHDLACHHPGREG